MWRREREAKIEMKLTGAKAIMFSNRRRSWAISELARSIFILIKKNDFLDVRFF